MRVVRAVRVVEQCRGSNTRCARHLTLAHAPRRAMGYAGYAPGHTVVEKTPIERALHRVSSEDAHDLLEKLTRNVARAPGDPKFRRLKASNATIAAKVFGNQEVLDCLLVLGWVREDVDGEDGLSLPSEVPGNMAHVRAIDAARIALRRRQEEDLRARIRARALDSDPERAALRAAYEADKAERKAAEPVTQGSVATQRGPGTMKTAKDVGASGSSGC